MPKRLVDLRGQTPLLDIASYGRRGPWRAHSLTTSQIHHIARTVHRVPEVMVKVSGGARTVRGVGEHLNYIGRDGEGVVEGDDGRLHQEKGFENRLLEDWDLDLEEHRRHSDRAIAAGRKPPKLVQNLVFSMPKGTPPDKLYAAVKKFTMENFALQHRYAMALHTDQGHPHVHVVVKALGDNGKRLNIRKATLRAWRRDFAGYLRDFGVEANATERAVRGEITPRKTDGIYRTMMRRDSRHARERAEGVVRELAAGKLRSEPGTEVLKATRRAVLEGWHGVADVLDRERRPGLAAAVRQFAESMRPPWTERELIANRIQPPAKSREIEDRSVTR
ncbi:MAG TPA: relaxase/mobilization nuclease domain-containing protein [Steroidobacteraceae bacterium]|jgi:hypothetical protein